MVSILEVLAVKRILEYVSTPIAARILQRCENTVRKLADRGALPSVRDCGDRRMFLRTDLEKFKQAANA